MDDYYTKIVIMATDGRIKIDEAYHMLDTCQNPEIFELLSLNMRLDVYENSPEHLRFMELTSKYETEKALNYRVW